MLGFWDWEESCKLVNANGHVILAGPHVSCSEWAKWWNDTTGRYPSITSVYAVSLEFYEEWKDTYALKGLLCEGVESGGGGEL